MLHDVQIEPGISSEILQNIKLSADKMENIDKYCILTFDEIVLKKRMLYNETTGSVTGFADFGDGQRTPEIADHALVIMLQGINSNYLIDKFRGDRPGAYSMFNGKKVYTSFDWPHLLKCLRNNLMDPWQSCVSSNRLSKFDYPGKTMVWDGGVPI